MSDKEMNLAILNKLYEIAFVNDDETIGDCVFHICTWLEGERILSDCVQFDSHNVRFYFHFDYKSGELKDFSRESLI